MSINRILEQRLNAALATNQKANDLLARRKAEAERLRSGAERRAAGLASRWPDFLAQIRKAATIIHNSTAETLPPLLIEVEDGTHGSKFSLTVRPIDGGVPANSHLILHVNDLGKSDVRYVSEYADTPLITIDVYDVDDETVMTMLIDLIERYVKDKELSAKSV